MKKNSIKVAYAIGFGVIIFTILSFTYLRFKTAILYPVELNGKYGYIDQNGAYVVPLTENQITDYQDGAAIVYEKSNNNDNITFTCKYINKKGEIFLNPEKLGYSNIIDDDGGCSAFSEGLILVSDKNANWYYMNKKGQIVIKTDFKGFPNGHDAPLGEFHQGLATFCDKDNSCGYINKKGEIILSNFTQNENFQNGLAYVQTKTKEGYINKKGQFVWSKDIKENDNVK